MQNFKINFQNINKKVIQPQNDCLIAQFFSPNNPTIYQYCELCIGLMSFVNCMTFSAIVGFLPEIA